MLQDFVCDKSRFPIPPDLHHTHTHIPLLEICIFKHLNLMGRKLPKFVYEVQKGAKLPKFVSQACSLHKHTILSDLSWGSWDKSLKFHFPIFPLARAVGAREGAFCRLQFGR